MTVNNRPEIREILNVVALDRNSDDYQSRLFVFRNRTHVDQKLEISPGVKFKTLYKISFTFRDFPFQPGNASSISNYSLLSFSRALPESTNAGNVEHYETYFTADFLNKNALELSEKLKLFNSQLTMTFLINLNQEWRIKEIFESMLSESLEPDAYKNDMMRILIYQLILFSQRFTPVDIQ